MDWLTAAGGIAFVMAVVTLIMDWIMQYWLVIRWGPNITKRLVIGEFKNKETARDVRDALGIPTRDDVMALKEELRAKDVSYQAALDARLGALVEELKTDAPRIDVEGIAAQIGAKLSGQMGAATKADNKARDAFVKEYEASAGAAVDQEIAYQMLCGLGIAPNLAKMAALGGPPAIRYALEYALGTKEAMKLTSEWDKARPGIMTIAGGK